MKNSSLLSALILGAALIFNGAGCKHGNNGIIKIPGQSTTVGGDKPTGPNSSGPGNTSPISNTDTGVTATPGGSNIDPNSKYADTLNNGVANADKFASDTVYFDTDSSAIKKSEEAKLQHVADYFKSNTTMECVRVEGYCDERGTEQYNLSLGEKRAGAVRDYLSLIGVDAQRIGTVSLGEAKPVDPGHDESAWKKNRRGVFILLTPK